MTDKNELEEQSRRKFLKTTGAVGVAATTGVAAFGGNAAAQNVDFDVDASKIGNVQGGLVNINVQASNIDVSVVEDVRVIVKNFRDVIDVGDILSGITIENVNVANANQLVVIVQALSSGGNVVGVARDTVQL